MTPEFHTRALRAHRLRVKGLGFPQIGGKLREADINTVAALIDAGRKISEVEGARLTDGELLLIKTLSRIEVRAIELDVAAPTTAQVDRAASKRSGWCRDVANKRLRMARDDEPAPNPFYERTGLVWLSERNAAVWLTAAGWALAWEAGFVLPNLKVPA